MRSWTTYAGRRDRDGAFVHFGDPRTVRAYGHTEALAVTLAEDPAGSHWGWLRADGEAPVPQMVHEDWRGLNMCFPAGVEAAERAGQGRVVRLAVALGHRQDAAGS